VTGPERARTEADPAAAVAPRTPSPPEVFLALCLAGGLALAVLIPPLASPDERAHLARAYLISEGTLLPPAETEVARATFPRSLVLLDRRLALQPAGVPPRKFERGEIVALFSQPLRPHVRVPAVALSYYTPFAYLPQAIAIGLLRLFRAPPVALVYAGRLANLGAYTALGWLALRAAPICRWPLCLLLLLPMSLSGAASLSCDGSTVAVSVLFAALAARAAYGPGERVERATARGLVASGAALGLVKPGYWLVAALALWIPARRFPSRRERLRLLAAVAAAVLGPYLLWGALLTACGVTPIHPPADPAGQLDHLRAQPWELAAVLARTLAAGFGDYVESFVGVLGRLSVHLPAPLWLGAPLALVAAALAEPKGGGPGPAGRVALAALFAAGALWVFALAYVSVNPPGARFVSGVQGRYLLPLAPLALLAIPPQGGAGPFWERLRARGAAGWAALLLAGAAHSVWRAYYGGA
jgi:hypothetical protein